MPSGVYERTERHKEKMRGRTPWNKGKVGVQKVSHSMETRKKISESHKGKKKPWAGKSLTEAGRRKLGRFITEMGRKKLRELRVGDKSSFWRGGFSSTYTLIRKHYKSRQWREAVFERDNYVCQFCEKRGGNLEADHIKLFSDIVKEYNIKTIEQAEKCEELWNIKNGRTLCVPCHNLTKPAITKKVREEEKIAKKRGRFYVI